MPFPGGIVRSGSKVGSSYKGLIASTNDAYCPTIRGQSARTALPPEVGAVLEIVIDGLTEADVAARHRRRRARRLRARSRRRRASRSAPATTAASSAPTTSICTRCWQ